jgi:hypothetical protein
LARLLGLEGPEYLAWLGLNLGNVLRDLGDSHGAIHAYRAAWQAGDPHGALALAYAYREYARDHVENVLWRAATNGNSTAAAVLACWQWGRTLDPALEPALRAGAGASSRGEVEVGPYPR